VIQNTCFTSSIHQQFYESKGFSLSPKPPFTFKEKRRIFESGILRMFPYTSVLIRTNKASEKITAVLCSNHKKLNQGKGFAFTDMPFSGCCQTGKES
ncbi:MAG: hypothetical protein IKC65_00030, partial [Lentisphaeria bacterium]|nr:hypothetical protein [Lentisphaeria bacterium]